MKKCGIRIVGLRNKPWVKALLHGSNTAAVVSYLAKEQGNDD